MNVIVLEPLQQFMMDINQSDEENNSTIGLFKNHTQVSRTGELIVGIIVSILSFFFIIESSFRLFLFPRHIQSLSC